MTKSAVATKAKPKSSASPSPSRDVAPAAEWMSPSKLKPWKDNPRKNDGEPVERVAKSIERFGFGAPIVARKANLEIIAGHTRWKAAKKLGLERVPVRLLDIGEKEAHVLALADNRFTELTEWDATLGAVLAGFESVDAAFMGWSDKDIREIGRLARGELADEDAISDPPANPVTKLGDVWTLGRHRLVCGDSTDAKTVARAKAQLEPFLMVTDPPYGVEYDPEWRQHAKGPDGRLLSVGHRRMGKVENDDRASWRETWRLFGGDVAYAWCSGIHGIAVALDLDAVGFERRAQIIWRKPSLVIGRGAYHWQHEPCWYAVRSGKPAKWTGDRTQSTVWDIAVKDGQGQTEHSTQKPVECMARPIRNHGAAGDVVYDPFCGSGTTLIAAEQLDRTCVGIELSPAYCDVIVERWQNLTGKKATRASAP
jgi:DNA modification methylase